MCGWWQKRALNPLKLRLQKVVNPMIGSGSFEKPSALNCCWGVFEKSGLFFSFWVIVFNASGVDVVFFLCSHGLSIFSCVLIHALCQHRWLGLNFISDWFKIWDDICWYPFAFTNINKRYLIDLQCWGTAHPCLTPHPPALLWSWAEVLQPLPPSLAMTSSCHFPLEPRHLNRVYNPIRAVNICFYFFYILKPWLLLPIFFCHDSLCLGELFCFAFNITY